MTAFLTIYLIASYTLSGFVCFLSLLGTSDRRSQDDELPKQRFSWADLGLPIWWPFWLVRECFLQPDLDNNSDRLFDGVENLFAEIAISETARSDSRADKDREEKGIKTRIKIQVPNHYREEPIISRLTSDYGLTFHITKAILTGEHREDGWFDLELHGTAEQIKLAFSYLRQRQVRIWCF
jgi:hypothetical protein